MNEGTSVPNLYRTWIALMILALITASATWIDLGPFNTMLAVSIAVMKALLIIIFFQEVKYGSPRVKLFAAAGFAWLCIMFALSLNDFLTRGDLHIAGK